MTHDPALRALLHEIVDYAGLFPPASLGMEAAVRSWSEARAGGDSWMLGRFLCPVQRLSEVHPLLGSVADGAPLRLAVILRHAPGGDEFPDFLAEDAATLRAFSAREGPRLSIEGLEVKLPGNLSEPSWLAAELEEAAGSLEDAGFGGIPLFVEATFGTAAHGTLGGVIRGIEVAREEKKVAAGLKIRCGGVEPSAFPTVDQLARALAACREASVPFKATAGLHHPLRHWNDGVRARMHGFLNLFGAAALSSVHELSEEAIGDILTDEDPAGFSFRDGRFHWRALSATADEVAAARRAFSTSFGSCSFDEPREDLRRLGLL